MPSVSPSRVGGGGGYEAPAPSNSGPLLPPSPSAKNSPFPPLLTPTNEPAVGGFTPPAIPVAEEVDAGEVSESNSQTGAGLDAPQLPTVDLPPGSADSSQFGPVHSQAAADFEDPFGAALLPELPEGAPDVAGPDLSVSPATMSGSEATDWESDLVSGSVEEPQVTPAADPAALPPVMSAGTVTIAGTGVVEPWSPQDSGRAVVIVPGPVAVRLPARHDRRAAESGSLSRVVESWPYPHGSSVGD
jgi:hypothetical protein